MRRILVVAFIIALAILFRHIIVNLWMTFIGDPILTYIGSSTINDIVVPVVFIASTTFFLIAYNKKKEIYQNYSLASVFFFIVCFYCYARIAPSYSDIITHFHISTINSICYGDVFAFEALLYSALTLRARKQNQDNGNKLQNDRLSSRGQIYDNTLPTDDLLDRRKDANILVRYILNNPVDSGLGVSVQGAWGTGKTTFLHYIEDELKTDGITYIWFNPWIENVSDVKYCFLQRLRSLIKGDSKLEKLLKEYVKQIKVTEVTDWFSLALLTLKRFLHNKPSLIELKEKIRMSLIQNNQTYVFFIDDCDRLDNNIFVEVVSLIRTVADLPHIIIITAFDIKRAEVVLKSEGGMGYLKKMFNINHLLLPLSNGQIAQYLTNESLRQKLPIEENHNPFDQFSIRDYLPTLREAKRYLNQIIKDYQAYKGIEDLKVLNWYKWFILELLKYYDGYLYEQLKNTPNRILEQKIQFSWNWQRLDVRKDFLASLNSKQQKLLTLLLNTYSSSDFPFDISNIIYYQCYFEAKLPSRFLTLKEFAKDIEDSVFNINSFLHYMNAGYSNLTNILEYRLKNCIYYDVIHILVSYVSAKLKTHQVSTRSSLQGVSKYQSISKIIADEPWVYVAVRESFTQIAFDEDDIDRESIRSFDDYIKNSKNLEIIAAILSGVMKMSRVDKIADIKYYYEDILKIEKKRENYANIIWMVADYPFSEIKDDFLDSFIANHIFDVIPYLLSFIQNDKQVYVIAKSKAVRGLFDTFDNYLAFTKNWKGSDDSEKEIASEFTKLLYFTGIYNGRSPRTLRIEEYPALQKYVPERVSNIVPIYNQKIDKDFWKTKSRFFDDGDLYFDVDPNV